MDLNDRALRQVTVGLGGPLNGIPREDGFDITVASEIMAILCLATDIEDLKRRLANIVIGYRYDRTPVSVGDLQVEGALALILRMLLSQTWFRQFTEHLPLYMVVHLPILLMDVIQS